MEVPPALGQTERDDVDRGLEGSGSAGGGRRRPPGRPHAVRGPGRVYELGGHRSGQPAQKGLLRALGRQVPQAGNVRSPVHAGPVCPDRLLHDTAQGNARWDFGAGRTTLHWPHKPSGSPDRGQNSEVLLFLLSAVQEQGSGAACV